MCYEWLQHTWETQIRFIAMMQFTLLLMSFIFEMHFNVENNKFKKMNWYERAHIYSRIIKKH